MEMTIHRKKEKPERFFGVPKGRTASRKAWDLGFAAKAAEIIAKEPL
jgi:hypothetical protein